MFPINVAPFEREFNRLSIDIRLISKKYCYNKEITNQKLISLLFVQFGEKFFSEIWIDFKMDYSLKCAQLEIRIYFMNARSVI